jgi:hypothetical protein
VCVLWLHDIWFDFPLPSTYIYTLIRTLIS